MTTYSPICSHPPADGGKERLCLCTSVSVCVCVFCVCLCVPADSFCHLRLWQYINPHPVTRASSTRAPRATNITGSLWFPRTPSSLWFPWRSAAVTSPVEKQCRWTFVRVVVGQNSKCCIVFLAWLTLAATSMNVLLQQVQYMWIRWKKRTENKVNQTLSE